MSSKGRGMATGFRLNDHNALCDRCQRKFWASDLKKEWTGWMVCDSCYDPRHEQESLKSHAESESVEWSRPDDTEGAHEYNGDESKSLVFHTNTIIQEWNTTFTYDRMVDISKVKAQKGDRFMIYKTVDDGKTLYITTTLLNSGTTV